MRVVPWVTDQTVTFLLNFIEGFEKENGRFPAVLEFGMGSSSLFFGDRSSSLVSFEHDPEWYAKTTAMMDIQGWAPEAHLLERPYSRKIAEIIGTRKFDLILIDGRDRVSCLTELLRIGALSKDGVFVIDNTERMFDTDREYEPMLDLLGPKFKVVHFEQNGRDRTGWQSGHRWLSTVAWRRDGRQYRKNGTSTDSLHGLRGLPKRLKRSIARRLK
jgi:hypothetical protein